MDSVQLFHSLEFASFTFRDLFCFAVFHLVAFFFSSGDILNLLLYQKD